VCRPPQLALRFPSHGGARPGAGRKPGPQPRVRHLRRAGIAAAHPLLVTWKVRRGLPSLRRHSILREVEASLAALLARPGFRVLAYSVQSNHAHFLVEAESAPLLGRGAMALGARLARAANRAFGRRGGVLADRYHARVLRTPREVRHALAYVLLNFRKHLAQVGRRAPAVVDPASSGRWFGGWAKEVEPSRDPPPVATAQSWLARVGWLRWGRIRLDETPGS
jgi:hypothetical protein